MMTTEFDGYTAQELVELVRNSLPADPSSEGDQDGCLGALAPERIDGKSSDYAIARMEARPKARHAFTAAIVGQGRLKLNTDKPVPLSERVAALSDTIAETTAGNLGLADEMLTAQALTLDALFTKLVIQADGHIGGRSDIAERYMRLALKAQAQSRATIEALVRIHQPREQTVHHRHYHIGPDGRAVFVENMHGGPNAQSTEQPYGQGAHGAALLGHDALGHSMPVSGHPREEAMPAARRGARKRRA